MFTTLLASAEPRSTCCSTLRINVVGVSVPVAAKPCMSGAAGGVVSMVRLKFAENDEVLPATSTTWARKV